MVPNTPAPKVEAKAKPAAATKKARPAQAPLGQPVWWRKNQIQIRQKRTEAPCYPTVAGGQDSRGRQGNRRSANRSDNRRNGERSDNRQRGKGSENSNRKRNEQQKNTANESAAKSKENQQSSTPRSEDGDSELIKKRPNDRRRGPRRRRQREEVPAVLLSKQHWPPTEATVESVATEETTEQATATVKTEENPGCTGGKAQA